MRSNKPEDIGLSDLELMQKYDGWTYDWKDTSDVTPEMKYLAKMLGYRKLPP